MRMRALRIILPLAFLFVPIAAYAQTEPESAAEPLKTPETKAVPEEVNVTPAASDEAIEVRLSRILEATDWYAKPRVRVDEGVVFLSGTADNEQAKEWASSLARRTQDVVAVVNQLDLASPPLWDLAPAYDGVQQLWRDSIALLPFLFFGFLVLLIAYLSARLSVFVSRRYFESAISSPLLREVLARTVGFLLLLFGVYIVLRVSGLTRLALTVIGGTGILGLVIGIAFRDITENFLASIFLSMQRPFLVGDLVEIVNVLGYVQRLNARTTVLMTLNGNNVEIPNATVYKSTIRNFSSNKNRREDFPVGIGYEISIQHAQEVALKVLREHPAVLKDPEPWALVEGLGSAAVNLRIYFWINGKEYSGLKVKSSVIRLVKGAFQDAGISMPDEAREVVFPNGIPIRMTEQPATIDDAAPKRAMHAIEPVSTNAEAGLGSEAEEIEGQARQSRKLDGDNLLKQKDPTDQK